MSRAIRPTVMAAALLLLAAGCDSSDGRALPPPAPHQTTTSETIPEVVAPSDDGGLVEVFSLTSPAFADGEAIPVEHSCDGAGTSPALQWASTPPSAELALVVRDPDADGFVHWVVTGIDATVTGFEAGGLPEAALAGPNDAGGRGWTGPCPPPGAPHRYVFTLHALPEPLVMPLDLTAQQAAQMVEQSSSAQAVLTGTYQR